MKTIKYIIKISEENKLAIIEELEGLTNSSLNDQFIIIGILDHLKEKHLKKINSLYEKTIK